jgi:hypothetical protein
MSEKGHFGRRRNMPYISNDWQLNISGEKLALLIASHVRIGYHPETYEAPMLPETDRRACTYVLGKSGMGKSALLENMIDPHTDLVSCCLEQISDARTLWLERAWRTSYDDPPFALLSA